MVKIYAPWTKAQVNCLQARQNDYTAHPYTCGNDSQHENLVPTPIGWVCPDCAYRQTWFMADGSGFFAERKRITPIFAWYDMWVGFFWDEERRILYFFPIPMFGFKIKF